MSDSSLLNHRDRKRLRRCVSARSNQERALWLALEFGHGVVAREPRPVPQLWVGAIPITTSLLRSRRRIGLLILILILIRFILVWRSAGGGGWRVPTRFTTKIEIKRRQLEHASLIYV
jgi:hypothetical protein